MTDHADDHGELVKFDFADAHRYTALAAALVPTASGDGRLIARLILRTDDPNAERIVVDLDRVALGAIIVNAAAIERLSVNGQLNDVAQQLDIATQIDNIDGGA
jgi:hypothetical protein